MQRTTNLTVNSSIHSSTRLEGFSNVARWIALDRDGESLIYREFREVTARNLLYLQCELLDIERQLKERDKIDANSLDMELKDAARTWETLKSQYKDGKEEAKTHMNLIMEMRVKLKEYRKSDLAKAINII